MIPDLIAYAGCAIAGGLVVGGVAYRMFLDAEKQVEAADAARDSALESLDNSVKREQATLDSLAELKTELAGVDNARRMLLAQMLDIEHDLAMKAEEVMRKERTINIVDGENRELKKQLALFCIRWNHTTAHQKAAIDKKVKAHQCRKPEAKPVPGHVTKKRRGRK